MDDQARQRLDLYDDVHKFVRETCPWGPGFIRGSSVSNQEVGRLVTDFVLEKLDVLQ